MFSINGRARERLSLFLLLCAISAAIVAPLTFDNAVPEIADYFNHFAAIIQAKLAIANGDFFLRTAPLEQDGTGYPFFQFYSPSSYLLAGLILKFSKSVSPVDVYKLIEFTFLVIAGIYIYRLAYWFVKSKPAAALASVAYLASPYYFIVINRFGAFNEAIAIGILPVTVFYTLKRFYDPNKDKTLLQVALCWYCLATIHLLTLIWAFIFITFLLLGLTFADLKKIPNLIRTLIACGFGFLMAAWTLGPVIVISPFLNAYHYLNLNDFSNYHNSLSNLFAFGFNVAGQPNKVIMHNIHPGIGLPFLIGATTCLYVVLNKLQMKIRRKDFFIVTLCMFFMIFFLVWSPFNFWKFLPRSLELIQFSSRLLGQIAWIGAVLFAWAVYWLFEDKLSNKHVAVGVILILLSVSSWYQLTSLPYRTYDKIFTKENLIEFNNRSYLMDVFAYKPVNYIHAFPLEENVFNNKIILNKEYKFVLDIVKNQNAMLDLDGETPKESVYKNIFVFINGKFVSTIPINNNHFQKLIPLPPNSKNTREQQYTIGFSITSKFVKDEPEQELIINKALIQNFTNVKNVITFDKTLKFCKRIKGILSCTIPVTNQIHLIELPQLYYPDMLEVKLNNKIVPYQNIMYGDKLIVGVMPDYSKLNKIEVKFKGLGWANELSQFGWGLWMLFLTYYLLNSFGTKFNRKVFNR